MRKYRTWACINVGGKKLWGDVFPDGEVSIQSMIARAATLEGVDGFERVFLVDWKALRVGQKLAVVLGKLCGVEGEAPSS